MLSCQITSLFIYIFSIEYIYNLNEFLVNSIISESIDKCLK